MFTPLRLAATCLGLMLSVHAYAQGARPPQPAPAPAPTAPTVPTAPAQPEPTAGHLALAREVITLTGGLSTVDALIPAFSEEIKRQAVTRPELTKDLNEVLTSLEPEMELQRQRGLNTVSRTYTKWLSEPEMREVIAFFKTPAGAKYIKVQPDLVDDVVNELQLWSQEASEYAMVRVRAEMGKRGHQMQ
jgi:hypothetical protein